MFRLRFLAVSAGKQDDSAQDDRRPNQFFCRDLLAKQKRAKKHSPYNCDRLVAHGHRERKRLKNLLPNYRVHSKHTNYPRIKGDPNRRHKIMLCSKLSQQGVGSVDEKADVHLYDTRIAEFKPYKTADKLIARADSLYQAGKKSDVYYAYRDVMYAYAENDSLFERVAYEMAQVQGENEEFMDAEGEYYAFYTMWPNSVNAEKAMFSRGFMLNENLGWNDKALKVLEEFLQKYPNSELKESAQWLVDNIKSDGKLADDLMKKIEAEE